MYLSILSVFIGFCLTIDLSKQDYLSRQTLCKKNRLCRLENCNIVKRVVKKKVIRRGDRFHPPDNKGGWVCEQPRKIYYEIFCAYGIWYKYFDKIVLEYKSENCELHFDDIITFNSIDSIQLDLQQSLKCQISEQQKDLKSYLCKGIEFEALFNIVEECNNQATNIISKGYQLEFSFNLTKQGDYQHADIDTVNYQLNNTKSELVRTSFQDYEIDTTNDVFKKLLQGQESILAKNIMDQIAAHIEKQES